MRIVFVITGLSVGGAEAMLLKLLENINREKYSVLVISLTNAGVIGPYIKQLGIDVDVMGLKLPFVNPLKFIQLIYKIKNYKPDIVHTWLYHADLLGGLSAKFISSPTILWGVRSSDFLIDGAKFTTRIVFSLCAKLSYIVPNYIIFNSQNGLEYHKGAGYSVKNALLILNGVDVNKFKPDKYARASVRKELGLNENDLVVGIVGRSDPLKSHRDFILAASLIIQQLPDLHFVMVGKGIDSSNEYLTDLIHSHNLDRSFHLLGPRKDIEKVTSSFDVASLTSISEAFPNVLIEAMSCGIPCVSTDVGDARNIVGEAGTIVPVGDVKQLAQQWYNLLIMPRDRRMKIGERGRDRVEKYYDIKKITKQYEELYENIACNKTK